LPLRQGSPLPLFRSRWYHLHYEASPWRKRSPRGWDRLVTLLIIIIFLVMWYSRSWASFKWFEHKSCWDILFDMPHVFSLRESPKVF
jgi:hypothetical protein